MIEGLLKDLKKYSDKLDEMVKEETGFNTFEDLLDADKDDFEKGIDKVLDRIFDRKKELENEIAETEEKIKEFKEEFEEDTKGVMFKVYEGTKNGHDGFAVEARGKLCDIMNMATKGIADLLKHNTDKFDDIEDIICAIGKTIRREFNKNKEDK